MTILRLCSLQLDLASSGNQKKIVQKIHHVLKNDDRTDILVLSELAVSGVEPDKKNPLQLFPPIY
uniref:CN hydrolase domain-containing protein n=1 Tax=uncultured marine bacterium MedDCM-OCT-S12-C289 TaxID=743082 RepID=D6PE97_9BACT|nr:hypothetical protein [uncultured marine bacterium MedDCM-OCT-S12-C289]